MSLTSNQSPAPLWTKPFAAAWRARAYFLIAFAFWLLSSTLPIPYSAVAPADRQWWQDLVDKGVGSFDKISYATFLAGLMYAVLSDAFEYVWNTSLQKEVEQGFSATGAILENSLSRFASGLVGMSYESVKVWVDGGKGSPEQMRAVALSSLKKHYGGHHSGSDNMIDFVMDDIIEGWAFSTAQTQENYSTTIVLRQATIPDHFQWEERKNYTVVCAAKTGKHLIRLEGSTQVGKNLVLEALNNMDFTIKFDLTTKVDFKAWWQEHRQEVQTQQSRFRVAADGNVIDYNGVWLRYEFSHDCDISHEKSHVAIFERSYISSQDRHYAIALRHPTRNMDAALTIEGIDCIVNSPVASAQLYRQGERIVHIESQHRQRCSARVDGWTLPGLALVIEWTPRPVGLTES
jgi:hypothetical protein